MSYKKPIETDFMRKAKVLQKLFSSGCKTEKDLQSLTLDKILKIKDITIPDLTVITELQQSVKNHTLLSYLAKDESEGQIE